MVPPVGYKFIPKYSNVCKSPGCFQCYDIYCERCESKDRRIIELEMRNNELVKHITLLQGRLFRGTGGGGVGGSGPAGVNTGEPFASVQSPPMYDPNLNINYVAKTSFAPVNQSGSREHRWYTNDIHMCVLLFCNYWHSRLWTKVRHANIGDIYTCVLLFCNCFF